MTKVVGNSKEKFLKELYKTDEFKTHYWLLTQEKYDKLLQEIKIAQTTFNKTSLHYRRTKRFDIIEENGVERIINNKRKNGYVSYFITGEEMFDVIEECHLKFSHAGRDRVKKEICKKYANITISTINLYLSMCEVCKKKRAKKVSYLQHSHINSKKSVSTSIIHFIDMKNQPDNDNTYIMAHQDYATKFLILKPLKNIDTEEICNNLLDIFTIFDAPTKLYCEKGLEFTNTIIEQLNKSWPELHTIQAISDIDDNSIETIENSVKPLLIKRTSWSNDLKFIQFTLNDSCNSDINLSPFTIMFNKDTFRELSRKNSNKRTIEHSESNNSRKKRTRDEEKRCSVCDSNEVDFDDTLCESCLNKEESGSPEEVPIKEEFDDDEDNDDDDDDDKCKVEDVEIVYCGAIKEEYDSE